MTICKLPAVGTRVAFSQPWDIFPLMIVPAGAVGVVVDSGDARLFAVKLDHEFPELAEWRNEVHFPAQHAEDNDMTFPEYVAEVIQPLESK